MANRRTYYSDIVSNIINKTTAIDRPAGFEHHAIVVNNNNKEVKEESGIPS